jgi:hypothetical protein
MHLHPTIVCATQSSTSIPTRHSLTHFPCTIQFDSILTTMSSVPHPSKSLSLSPKEQPASSDGGLRWIVSDNLEGFKSKENMQTVRQTAMASFLKTEKIQEHNKSRANSEVLEHSRSSVGSEVVSKLRPHAAHGKKSNDGRKQRSPTKASPFMYLSTTKPHSESQRTSTQGSFQGVLLQAPIVVPIIQGKEYRFDAFPMPRLVSIGESLDPFRTMFQSNCPHVSVTQLKHHCRRYFGTKGLGIHWIPICLDYPHTFLSTLYMASMHHDIVQNREVESLETAALRQDVIHIVGGNLTNPEQSVADHQIIAVSQLILGDIIGRNEGSLKYHQAGLETMIQCRGGLVNLGVAGHLASTVSWAHLATSVLQEVEPIPLFMEYCSSKSTKTYPPTKTIPESPLYYPHGKYVTLERSQECKPDTLSLLDDTRMMIEALLLEKKQSRRSSDKLIALYTRITQYPSIQNLRRVEVLRESDWKYEAIRIAAVIQATAILNQIPLSDALQHVQSYIQPQSVYTSSIASKSNDSLVSPFDVRNDTPVTEYSASPSFSTHSTLQQPGFPFNGHRESDTSLHSFTSAQRPSVASFQSTSSDLLPWSRNAVPTSTELKPLADLRDALEKSNLSECWSDMAGVLLWIGLVMGAASSPKHHDNVLRRYFSATTMRACIMLCFEHPEAVHATMLRMTEVVDALSKESNAQMVRKESCGPRKRTRA